MTLTKTIYLTTLILLSLWGVLVQIWAGSKFLPQVVKVFDVCGAGDTFMAALVYEFLKTQNMQKSIDLANRAAAISVTHPGAYYLTQNDIESLYGGGDGQNGTQHSGSNAHEITSLVERTYM